MLAAYACDLDLEIYHLDIEQAFVDAELEPPGIDVYMPWNEAG